MFYAQSTRGFYDTAIHGSNIPSDAVEITNEEWQALLQGQSEGKVITPGENGVPYLAEPVPPAPLTQDELDAQPVTVTRGELNALMARLEAVERKRTK